MRLPKHHLITDAQQQSRSVAELGLRPGQSRAWPSCQVDGAWGQAQVTALAGGEYLFLFGTVPAPLLGQLYRKRWTIEQCFQNLKGRGFDLRSTHLQCRVKRQKLVALVSLAYALCVSLGSYQHRKVHPIPVKNHGRKSTSFSRCGLDLLREMTRPRSPGPVPMDCPDWKCSCDGFLSQITYVQQTKIVG